MSLGNISGAFFIRNETILIASSDLRRKILRCEFIKSECLFIIDFSNMIIIKSFG